MSLFPNVPNLPGVPPLLRSPQFPPFAVPAIAAAASLSQLWHPGQAATSPWGIFDSQFNSVLSADNFTSFRNRRQANLLDFPVQAGGFATYNKVQVPFIASIRVSKGGSLDDRARLLAQLDLLQESMELFTIITPEKSYPAVNVESYEVTRIDKDAAYYLTDVELFFREIRVVSAQFTNTPVQQTTTNAQSPSAQPPTNQGIVQPATPSNVAQNAATTALASATQ